ncbi:MAG: AAA family ATPase [Prevotellaceae bacterium]|nr:AAA family ATPase [Prevotellaceae bacterium]MDO4931389.1 AAA family ATPase [Prevotellaceae bacterium]
MKYAEYIKQIEIDSLWNGRKHIKWQLDRHVNILSGVNGVGKSTILSKVLTPLVQADGMVENGNGVRLMLHEDDADTLRFDTIRSFDRPLISSEITSRLDFKIVTELDLQLFKLQRRYLDYQVNLGNRIIEMLQSGRSDAPVMAQRLSENKKRFHDIVDSLFADTKKTIIRTENEIRFMQMGETLMPYQLSSGEKQMLVILLTVLVQDQQPYVLFMDEPEVSLHIEWQKQLLNIIMEINPNVQVILTTHSPAVIMDGWTDRVTEVSEIEVG